MLSKTKKIIYISTGTLFVGLGVAGIFIPILPTTPFLLVAAALYAKSSNKFLNMLLGNRFFGNIIRNYREKKGMSLKVKIITISFLLITISFSIFFFADNLIVIILLAVVAAGVSTHIVLLRTIKK